MNKTVIILLVSLFLTSCATLPVPKNLDEGLVLIDYTVNQAIKGETFGQYRVELKATDSDYRKIVRIPVGKGTVRVLLPEGRYRVEKCDFVYDWGTHGNSFNINTVITVKAGEISVYPLRFVSLAYKEGDSYWMSLKTEALSAVEKKAKVESIAHMPNFELWDNKYNVEPIN